MKAELLTTKQKSFVWHLVKGASLADAYRKSYDVSKMSDQSVYVEASRLMQNPKIEGYYRQLQEQQDKDVLKDAAMIRAHVASRLYDESQDYEKGTPNSRIMASVWLGKEYGMFREKGDVAEKERKVEDIEAELMKRINKLLGSSRVGQPSPVVTEDAGARKAGDKRNGTTPKVE